MSRENWTSSLGFILASAGSAIGLGNVWKFPYVAGQHGGGTFVLVYVLCVALVGLPVMCAEMLIGRAARRNVINAMGKAERLSARPGVRYALAALFGGLAVAFAQADAWLLAALALVGTWAVGRFGFSAVGWICAGLAMAILSYYAVVGGWLVEYLWRALSGTLTAPLSAPEPGVPEVVQVAKASQTAFGAYLTSPWRVLAGFLVFMALTGAVIWGGIQKGIERVSRVLMPALFILMLAVIVRSVTLPGAWEGVVFLFRPTRAALEPQVVLMALGQAFFSLSLGMAITVTYGSYLKREQNIFKAAGFVGLLDTLAALLAGLAIFPAVFAVRLEPSSGPGLVFGALPATFSAMWLGRFWAVCFFVMLLIAAVTSSASLLECGATIFIERLRRGHRRCSRSVAVLIGFALCSLMGTLSVVSTADWSNLPGVRRVSECCLGSLAGASWFDMLDNLCSNWGLPLTALSITLLIGWGWSPRRALPALCGGKEPPRWVLWLWVALVRWIAPAAIVLVFFNASGLMES